MDYRIFVEKKPAFRVEAEGLCRDLNENLQLNIESLRLLNVYDLFGFTPELLEKSRYSVFGETVTDTVSDGCNLDGCSYLAVEYLPGQFDQRAYSAEECVRLIEPEASIKIKSSRLLIFSPALTGKEMAAVKHYYINAVESREKDLSKLSDSEQAAVKPVPELKGFRQLEDLEGYCSQMGLAMNAADLQEVINYFKDEKRDPTETELRILDTYWSDHCRHTTFTTELDSLDVEKSFISEDIKGTISLYLKMREDLGRTRKGLNLMDMATIGAKYLRSIGKLDDMEVSEENNACSIFVDVDEDGKVEKWLLQFKNETHNHPTEIEPFGGAATCLGGAIRDPLSGRAYVYQAMRVTGAGDIWKDVADTIPGKLPQKVISRKAAAGYSSYGNQIGLATTMVREIHHEGYIAKRLEIGAVVGAVKAENVRRESPVPGDVILLLGGRTGRDGIGGATGSSKEHTEASLETCGSEVQKGNAPEERKIQRLFRRPEVTRLIKKSNDFGAGGVSVAIGELADGLDIHLERVPVKYSGLNSTELAISESQERMAVVVERKDMDKFAEYCRRDNIELTYVADVTDSGRMRMYNGGVKVADLTRAFIDSAGAKHHTNAIIRAVEDRNPFHRTAEGSLEDRLTGMLSSPNVCSQKGLVEMFDASIGRSTVLMPYGGANQSTETQVSVQKLPTDGFTMTASMMAYGFNPYICSWSPYHGAAYSVIEACTKIAAAGGDWSGMRFSYQEYFERMTKDPGSWGKPASALLGALRMQYELGLPAIGGKDSMSGTFENINVPPTLVAFGITTVKADKVISPEFKKAGDSIYLIKHTPLPSRMPDTEALKKNWNLVHSLIDAGTVVAGWSVSEGGVAEALCKMSFGNSLAVDVKADDSTLFDYSYGSIVVESTKEIQNPSAVILGTVTEGGSLVFNGCPVSRTVLEEACFSRHNRIYPQTCKPAAGTELPSFAAEKGKGATSKKAAGNTAGTAGDVKVYIPVFPGTNCDYDTAKAFRRAGATVKTGVFCNLDADAIVASIDSMEKEIDSCNILAFAGGFSEGDEPDGSGKFIASVICNAKISAAIERLLARNGLILGICNGFQALIKSGLLPYGKPGNVTADSPTLFRNDISRHVSQMVTTRVASVKSPWLSGFSEGELHTIAVSHGEGKFVASGEMARRLFEAGQVAFQYADPHSGEPTMESPFNPNGSTCAIEGIISPDGKILGKMGHSERWEEGLFRNIPYGCSQDIFSNAVRYFKEKHI